MDMNWVNMIVTVLAFLIIFLHQRHRIKNLSDQITGQQYLFNNMKAFLDGINPELLVFRTKQYEELVDKKLEIQVKEIEENFRIKNKSTEESHKILSQWFLDLMRGIIYSLPNQSKISRQIIVNEIKMPGLKKLFEDEIIPQAEKMQLEARKTACNNILSLWNSSNVVITSATSSKQSDPSAKPIITTTNKNNP
jgi:hypothetical protein